MNIKIAVSGCCGRMGKRIVSLALLDKEIKVTGLAEAKGHPDIGKAFGKIIGEETFDIKVSDNLSTAAKDADLIIDFTTPTATLSSLSVARKLKIPIVVGTTGLTDEEHKVVKSTSGSVPVLLSANMSIGVNLLFRLVPEIANALGEDYNIEIVEVHHNKKKDSPSGTAKTLAQLLADTKERPLKDLAVYGREGNVGQRSKREIGIHAVRAGDVVGDHTIIYAGDNERIEITHRAHSRDVFANGALRGAKYIADKSPGLYTMQDVLEGV
ncbi:MAG: 4-hydroxy-tetrahydrodipicolinate reductase [Candidatus Omnitrophica bacterium]|nr:4-hydroxy-tetrahydrodipicolinate reductase [Candidatus Omnitrophota bacterium]